MVAKNSCSGPFLRISCFFRIICIYHHCVLYFAQPIVKANGTRVSISQPTTEFFSFIFLYTTKIKSTLYRLLLKIFSFSTCHYANQIKPLIQRTPTGRLSPVACFKTLEYFYTFPEIKGQLVKCEQLGTTRLFTSSIYCPSVKISVLQWKFNWLAIY